MSKFDRCIFISIAVGIWALAMTQVFKPEAVIAMSQGCGDSANNPCLIANEYNVAKGPVYGKYPLSVSLGKTLKTSCWITGWRKVDCTTKTFD